MGQDLDFLAIGDITIDAFIELSREGAHVMRSKDGAGKKEICMSFGDKIPYEGVEVVYAVGNSPNAAVSAARLGLRSALVTNLGADENGDRCLGSLAKDGVRTDYVTRHPDIKTNYHYVLRYEEERTILVKHEAYPYALPDFPAPTWLYLSSLGGNSLPYHADIARWAARNPETKLAFQPGTFQMKLGPEKLADIYSRTTLFVCNIEEAERILGLKNQKPADLIRGIHALGPTIVAVTDGPRGAYASDESGMWFMPPYPDPAPPVSRTGAGDAFTSTLVSALALGRDLTTAITWAPINSMSVVQQIGAQKGLLSRAELERYLAESPADYRPRKIN